MANPFSGPERPKAPMVTPPARMPDPFDPAVLDAKKRAQVDALARGGKQSTILTGAPPTPSAYDTFTGKTLGAA